MCYTNTHGRDKITPSRVTRSFGVSVFTRVPTVPRPHLPFYPQVPLTARERPSHGVHRSSVFQAEVQSAAQVSALTLPASGARTEAHLPSPRGEKQADAEVNSLWFFFFSYVETKRAFHFLS